MERVCLFSLCLHEQSAALTDNFYFVWLHALILCIRVLTKSHKWKQRIGNINNFVSIVSKKAPAYAFVCLCWVFIHSHCFPEANKEGVSSWSCLCYVSHDFCQCEWCRLWEKRQGIGPLSVIGEFWAEGRKPKVSYKMLWFTVWADFFHLHIG